MQTIDNFNFAGKKAFVRVDFNVPLDEKLQHHRRHSYPCRPSYFEKDFGRRRQCNYRFSPRTSERRY